jgi:hypothetical protein
VIDGDQLRRGSKVGVAEIVLNRLEVPEALPGAGIEGNEAVPEKVVPGTIGTVEVVAR